ncbi:hypothetical protein [Roseovarius sp. EL26]|uniref:hypothetical protein n=1 Tax=Roseovarius sp. EL26 TaxID=2126672 RepID=UPI0013C40D70|nr:hypothetical protein [Roseovarius sp. EL26]
MTLLRHVSAPTAHQYHAELRSSDETVDLQLPARIPLEAIVVTAGEVITQGQTIATFDHELMQLELDNLRRSVLVGSSLRHCLLTPDIAALMTTFPAGLDAESQLQMRAAFKDCKLSHQENALQIQRLQDLRDRQSKRLIMLGQRAKLAFALTSKVEGKAATAIEFSLEQNRLQKQLTRLDYELRTLSTKQERGLLQRAKVIQQDVKQDRQYQTLLKSYLNAPRLQSPATGKVLRVRRVSNGQSFQRPITIVTMQNSSAVSYRAIFYVPQAIAESLQVDDEVQLSLTGLTPDMKWVTGTISRIESALHASVSLHDQMVTVDVDENTMRALGGRVEGMAAAGATTHAALVVTLERQRMNHALWQAASALILTRDFEDWTHALWPKGKQADQL